MQTRKDVGEVLDRGYKVARYVYNRRISTDLL